MEQFMSLNKRRTGVLVNYLALLLGVLLFEGIRYDIFPPAWLVFLMLGILLVFLVVSFTYIYGLTGLWSLAHRRTEKLDEREIQVVTRSVRIAYSVFTILVIVMVYLFAIFGMGPFDVIIAAALLYLAHVLPISILAWTEKEV